MYILCVKDALGLVVLGLQGGADLVKAGEGQRSFGVERDFEGRKVLQVALLEVHIEDDVSLLGNLLDTSSQRGSATVHMDSRHPSKLCH